MGGAAFLIPGELDDGRLQALEAPAPSLWARLLGRAPARARVHVEASGERHFEVPPGPLGPALIADFRRWVVAAVDPPAEGTAAVLEYLEGIEPSVHVRGRQAVGAARPAFSLQITFSGCAGMAETSARVCEHWAGRWWESESARLRRDLLEPWGFRPGPQPPAVEPMRFLPAGPLGYLEHVDDAFELDQAVLETPDGENADLSSFAAFMKPPRCRCALCEPGFGDAGGGEEA
jgi:hypothetical protein